MRTAPLDRLHGIRAAQGLSSAEVARRRAIYGRNDVVEKRRRAWRDLLRETARDPMLWFLAGTSSAYLVLGQQVEGIALLVAMLPLLGMDALLHYRTAASTESLSARLANRATVERDGEIKEIAATELVPGDLVEIQPGGWLPADGLFVSGENLQLDESSLTGESYPVEKRARKEAERDEAKGDPLEAIDSLHGVPIPDLHWGFAGTRILTGKARLRVLWTGGETLYGQIIRSAISGAGQRTPLQDAIASLVQGLVIGAVAICLILAYVRLQQGFGWLDALISGVTLAVAALPEEFPVVFTVFLGVGVYRLAQRNALVRRAVSVENIGRVTCICSDKTGTITEGRLDLTHLLAVEGTSEAELLALAGQASRSDSGDPLDEAIQRSLPARDEAPTIVAVFPFTEGRKRETVVLRTGERGLIAVTKGAGELVLEMTALSPADRILWRERIEQYAREGHKLIGCAWRELGDDWAGGEPDRGYRFGGLLAFEDAVREGVPEAVRRCRAAGIRVIMVTGDHPTTAAAVAQQIGLGPDPHVVSGDELDELLEDTDRKPLRTVEVIARAVPAQKADFVRALQGEGEIVAVTGDGVNDVPALQSADIGVAMGQRGTRSAREAAAIVLLDDNFRSIVWAIGEGQQLFDNLRYSFQYLLMIHLPLVLTAAIIPLAGFPLLYLPLHIVWLELVIHPSAMLAFQERAHRSRLERRAQPRGRFFSWREWIAILVVGGLVTAAVLVFYLRSLEGALPVEHARANALAALSLSSASLVAGLSGLRTAASRWITAGTIVLTVVVVQTPGVFALLHVRPLHADDWALVAAAASAAGALAAWLVRSKGRTT